jgi:formylglycine-generating enzyme required for sulfatase activity
MNQKPMIPKADDTKSAEEAFEYAATLAHEGQLDQAELLFQQALEADKTGNIKKPIERWLRELGAYKRIVRYADKPATLRDARDMWSDYIFDFGDGFDPLDLAEKLTIRTKPVEHPPYISPLQPPKIEEPPAKKIIASGKLTSLDLMPQPFAWVDIPAGKVILTDTGGYLKKDTTFDIPAFKIAKYPTTNAQFDIFINHADGYKNPQWWDFSDNAKKWRVENTQPQYQRFDENHHPRENITWYESVAFCRWLSAITDEKIMLPTEQQWQRAAQGDDRRDYPWGSEWYKSRCNNSVKNMIGMGSANSTTPVTEYEGKGDSPYGVVDMSGNVWEWCSTSYHKGENNLQWTDIRVLKGGSWSITLRRGFLASFRFKDNPSNWAYDVGFRLVCSY